jgi:hypothetical protein
VPKATHKSGGHGQFGLPRQVRTGREQKASNLLTYYGGAIPHNWIPSVERGIRETARRFLASFHDDFRARSTTANITM